MTDVATAQRRIPRATDLRDGRRAVGYSEIEFSAPSSTYSRLMLRSSVLTRIWPARAIATVALLLLTGCSAPGQPAATQQPVFSIQGKTVVPMDFNVLTVDEGIALLGDPSAATQYVGRPCPVKQGSTALVGGQVRVTDSHGAVVALGKVGSDPKMIAVAGSMLASPLACELSFTVDSVPDLDRIYTIQLAQKAGVSFTREQLSAPIELSPS